MSDQQSSKLSKVKVKEQSLSHVRLFATPWTVAYQDPESMGFSRQEYWSGVPFPSPGDLPNPGIKPGPPALQADALLSEIPGKKLTVKAIQCVSESRSVMSDSLRPHGLHSPWNSPGQNTWSGQPFPSPENLPNPEFEPRSPKLQADSLPAEPKGSPFPSPGDLPNPGIEPRFPALQADALLSEPAGKSKVYLKMNFKR